MSDLLLASVSEKGQVTIPKSVRKALGISPHTMVGFRLVRGKVQLLSVEITEKEPYTEEEWSKIKKMVKQKGKSFDTPDDAKKYLRKL